MDLSDDDLRLLGSSRLAELREFAATWGGDRTARRRPDLDALLTEVAQGTDLRESARRTPSLEELAGQVTQMTMRSRSGVTRQISWGGPVASGRLGHGPLDPWIPHTCHKKVEICWPGPPGSGVDICLEIEFPWPCNPPWPLPGPD